MEGSLGINRRLSYRDLLYEISQLIHFSREQEQQGEKEISVNKVYRTMLSANRTSRQWTPFHFSALELEDPTESADYH